MIDLKQGLFFRLAQGRTATRKRQPPVPTPPRLLAHLRRWAEKGFVSEHVVAWNGWPINPVEVGFGSAVKAAGLMGTITPHTLRHTCSTSLMQNSVAKWEASGFLGMSVEMIDAAYGLHYPDHLRKPALKSVFAPADRACVRQQGESTRRIVGHLARQKRLNASQVIENVVVDPVRVEPVSSLWRAC